MISRALSLAVVALVVLGPARLPDAFRQMGRAMAEFRKWSTGVTSEFRDAFEPEPQRISGTPVAPSQLADGAPPTPTPADLDPEHAAPPRDEPGTVSRRDESGTVSFS